MKNALSLSVFFFPVFLFSQNFSVGFNTGISIAPPGTDFKMGISAGGYFIFHLTDFSGIRSEVNFERKGEQIKNRLVTSAEFPEGRETNYRSNFDYWQVPVLLELSGGKK